MHVTHCYVCNRPSGFSRRLGWGTFFMVILTAGFWLLAIPFYPKRCTTCGCTEGGAARASLAMAAGPPGRQRQLLTAYGIIGTFVVVVFCIWLANLEPSKTVPLPPASTQTVSNAETTESAIPAAPLRGKLRLTIDESLDSPREITIWPNQRGSVFMSNGYLVNPKSQMRISRMDLLCIVSQPNCYALIPGMTYGADVVQQGEADYVHTVPLALTRVYGCIRIYGPDHVYLYAVGTNEEVGIPTVDEAANLPVKASAGTPRYAQPVQDTQPSQDAVPVPAQPVPAQSPSPQAPIEVPSVSSDAAPSSGKPDRAPPASAEGARSDVLMVTVTETKVVKHIDPQGHAMLLARAYRKDAPDDRFSLICHTARSSCSTLREGEDYNARILQPGDPSYDYDYAELKGAIIVRIDNAVFALMREKKAPER